MSSGISSKTPALVDGRHARPRPLELLQERLQAERALGGVPGHWVHLQLEGRYVNLVRTFLSGVHVMRIGLARLSNVHVGYVHTNTCEL